MSVENLPVLKENSTISRLVMPLGEEEWNKLEEDVRKTPQNRIITVWDDIHLSDKQRYEACKKLGLDFTIRKLHFSDVSAAAFYVCGQELERTDLTQMYRKYLIGQRHILAVEKSRAAKLYVAQRMAKDMDYAAGTILKYASSSAAMNQIFSRNMELAFYILLEKTRVSHENIVELSRLTLKELNSLTTTIINDKIDHVDTSFIRHEAKYSHIQTKNIKSRKEKEEERLMQHVSIRQMPVYNPDAEVNSLCMTVDSWVSTINRVSNSENFCKISEKASLQLMKKLTIMEQAVHNVQEQLVERKSC